MRIHCPRIGLVAAQVGLAAAVITPAGADWPQWRGPDRSNRSLDTELLKAWPTNGPPLLWKATGLGQGIASVAVAGGRAYTIGYRDGGEFVFALSAQTGELKWASRVGPAVKENALMRWLTQRTPTIDEDRVYTLTANGELICLRSASGEKVWQRSYTAEFYSKPRSWGFSDYPLVDGNKLICSPVGPEVTVAALDKKTGVMTWASRVPGSDSAGYAATVISEAGGVRQYVLFLSRGLVGLAASDGRFLWRYDKTTGRAGNTYTPIVAGELVFSANGYGGGMALLKLVRNGDGIAVDEQYYQGFNFNAFQDSTVRVGDYVYSYQAPGKPICIELKSGKVAWGPIAPGTSDRAALTYADGHLYMRRASGAMILAEASPRDYVEKGSFIIPDREEASGVTSPVVAGGLLYLRDNDRLLCYDVRVGALTKSRPAPRRVELVFQPGEGDRGLLASPRIGRNRPPDAAFVTTPADIIEEMLELAALRKEDIVYDLGSGDGRLVIAAAKKHGCRAVGYEIDPKLVALSREAVVKENLESSVRIEHEDIFTVELSGADVSLVYLPSGLLQRLMPQLKKLKPGTRIVSHQFQIPGVTGGKAVRIHSKEDGDEHRLWLWTAPLQEAGLDRRGK